MRKTSPLLLLVLAMGLCLGAPAFGGNMAFQIERVERKIAKEDYDSAIEFVEKALEKEGTPQEERRLKALQEEAHFHKARTVDTEQVWSSFLETYPWSDWLLKAREGIEGEPSSAALRQAELQIVRSLWSAGLPSEQQVVRSDSRVVDVNIEAMHRII